MSKIYVLDTNAYALLFQMPRGDAYRNLESVLTVDSVMNFSIPEIVSMEIHSVLGKFRRGAAVDSNIECGRKFRNGEQIQVCANICFYPKRTRMKGKVFKALQKLVSDIENQNGDIKASLLPMEQAALDLGKKFLQLHSHQYSFGSHDALVAGTVAAGIAMGRDFVLVTSDKALKALCRDQKLPTFDPVSNEITSY